MNNNILKLIGGIMGLIVGTSLLFLQFYFLGILVLVFTLMLLFTEVEESKPNE